MPYQLKRSYVNVLLAIWALTLMVANKNTNIAHFLSLRDQ